MRSAAEPLSKELLRQLRRIEILTGRMADSELGGNYTSVFKGQGLSFQEVRAYHAGDDVRFIDWNVSARLGQPFVKVFSEERELSVMLLVDCSRSQQWASRRQSKAVLAAQVSALCALSASHHQDRVGLILFTNEVECLVPPKKGDKHVMRVVREVLGHQPKGHGTNLAVALETLTKVAKRRSVVFLISDFFGQGHDRALALASSKHDIIPVMLRDPADEALPDLGLLEVEDLESGEPMLVDSGDARVRQHYADFMRRHHEAQLTQFRRLGLDVAIIRTDADMVDPLRKLFAIRARRGTR